MPKKVLPTTFRKNPPKAQRIPRSRILSEVGHNLGHRGCQDLSSNAKRSANNKVLVTDQTLPQTLDKQLIGLKRAHEMIEAADDGDAEVDDGLKLVLRVSRKKMLRMATNLAGGVHSAFQATVEAIENPFTLAQRNNRRNQALLPWR